MKCVNPEMGDEEEMSKNLSAVLLGGQNDFREAGAVQTKLNKAGV